MTQDVELDFYKEDFYKSEHLKSFGSINSFKLTEIFLKDSPTKKLTYLSMDQFHAFLEPRMRILMPQSQR